MELDLDDVIAAFERQAAYEADHGVTRQIPASVTLRYLNAYKRQVAVAARRIRRLRAIRVLPSGPAALARIVLACEGDVVAEHRVCPEIMDLRRAGWYVEVTHSDDGFTITGRKGAKP